jgi:hypothetical protein
MSWNLSPQELIDAGVTTSVWRITGLVLDAILLAVVPAITLAMLQRPSPALQRRLANPKRKRRQAVNYPHQQLT